MPELPEVETLARDLQQMLHGAQFTSVDVLWPRSVAMPSVDEFVTELPGRTILGVGRRGKVLLFSLSGPSCLMAHLRMSGRLLVEPAGATPGEHARVVFHLSDCRQLIFSNPRKLGRLYLAADADTVVGDLGLEPLGSDFTSDTLSTMLSRRKGALKPLLLNQRFLAGLGNIYADEALFEAGLHPLRKANTLSPDETERLHGAIRGVLQRAIDNRGTTLADGGYVDADRQSGRNQHSLRVYHRHGQACSRCGQMIERIKVHGRGTHFCPGCQR